MSIFAKYPSIENSYRQKTIDFIQTSVCSKEMWHVTEKFHGANVSFIIEEPHPHKQNNIVFCKRSGIIGNMDEFYGSRVAYDSKIEKVAALFAYLTEAASSVISSMQLYGEIVGGRYDLCDKSLVQGPSVQKEVQYCPHKEIVFFDLRIDREFVNKSLFYEYMERFDLLYAKPLFCGSLEDCLNYPNLFQTKLPAVFGLPEIEGNTCEGVVICPDKFQFLPDGSRVILKNKNQKFSEEKPKNRCKKIDITEDQKRLVEKIGVYITENRLKNVISKLENVSNKDFGKISGLLMKDCLEEFRKDFDIESIDKKDIKVATKMAQKEAANLVRKSFLNIIDGNF